MARAWPLAGAEGPACPGPRPRWSRRYHSESGWPYLEGFIESAQTLCDLDHTPLCVICEGVGDEAVESHPSAGPV